MRVEPLALAVVLGAGCLPPLLDTEGKPCDVPHPCPAALTCVAGACTRQGSDLDAGLPNLLVNPDFEDRLSGWFPTPQTATLVSEPTLVKVGSLAARVRIDDLSLSQVGIDQKVELTLAPRYCAAAWINPTGLSGDKVYLVLRASSAADVVLSTARKVASDGAGWNQVQFFLDVPDAGDRGTVAVRVVSNTPDGGSFVIDDVHLWAPPDGGCD